MQGAVEGAYAAVFYEGEEVATGLAVEELGEVGGVGVVQQTVIGHYFINITWKLKD